MRRWENGVESHAVVEIGQMARRLLAIIVVRRGVIVIVIAIAIIVMMMHDHFDMLGVVRDKRCLALMAADDMHEVTVRGGSSLPGQ